RGELGIDQQAELNIMTPNRAEDAPELWQQSSVLLSCFLK
ncbi:unnamed protein product, partial [Tetraodon nigroviridis]